MVHEELNQGDRRQAKVDLYHIYPAFRYLQTVHSCIVAQLQTQLVHLEESDEAQALQLLVVQQQRIGLDIFVKEVQEVCIKAQKTIIHPTDA